MLNKKHSQVLVKIVKIVIAFIFISPPASIVILFISVFIDIEVRRIPSPTPFPMSLTVLPLPDAAITPGPAVTPDWESEETSFTRELNSEVQIYTNRFGLQWFTTGQFTLRLRIFNGQYVEGLPARLQQYGDVEGRLWIYDIIFPWPIETFEDEVSIQIDGSLPINRGSRLPDYARGPAAAEFIERDPNPPTQSDEVPLARCRYHVEGQITLTSYSPIVGHFQFACQFDNQEYALVSGRFWE